MLIYLRRSILQDELAVHPRLSADFEENPDRYYEELVPGKEYITLLPKVQGIQKEDIDMENTAIFNTLGFTKSDHQIFDPNREHNDDRIGVWSSDDISPASYMLS